MDHFTIREVTVNYRGRKRKTGVITDPWVAANFVRKVLPNNSQEHLIAIYLDGSNTPIAYSVVHTGTAVSSPLGPREVFQRACLVGACSLIVAHNHPSGCPQPSDPDREASTKLKEGARLLGMNLLDHLVVTETDYASAM